MAIKKDLKEKYLRIFHFCIDFWYICMFNDMKYISLWPNL